MSKTCPKFFACVAVAYVRSPFRMALVCSTKRVFIGLPDSPTYDRPQSLHKPDTKTLKSGGDIYKITCKDCGLSYVGESGRPIKTRLAEHTRAIRNGDLTYATATHAKNFGHVFDMDNVKILNNRRNWNQRLWLEATYIHTNFRRLNGNIGKRTISNAWDTHLNEFIKFYGNK